jgi:hypothetical protein
LTTHRWLSASREDYPALDRGRGTTFYSVAKVSSELDAFVRSLVAASAAILAIGWSDRSVKRNTVRGYVSLNQSKPIAPAFHRAWVDQGDLFVSQNQTFV